LNLQILNRRFYKSFTQQWLRVIFTAPPAVKLTKVIVSKPNSVTEFRWPTEAKRKEYISKGVVPHLIGFENDERDKSGFRFNFVLSNGDRSAQRDA